MKPVTKVQAREMLTALLKDGETLTIKCNNGDKVTVGRAEDGRGWAALRWGRSRWALPSGKQISWDPCMAAYVACDVVEHCGRGNVARACREKTAIKKLDRSCELR